MLDRVGYLTLEEIKYCSGFPSLDRMKEGPVVCIECNQEIPCNPCEFACPYGAITVGNPITNIPILNGNKCKGCGLCIACCPGLAIFLIDLNYSQDKALISFPFEYLPLPNIGDNIKAVNRAGKVVANGKVIKVDNKKANDRTPVVSILVPKEWVLEVRGIKLPLS